jgi:choline-sulfatase
MAGMRWLFCFVALTTGALGVVPKPKAPSSEPKSPNIILITVDTTRADRMGFLGSRRGLTPNLDALARKSVIFTRAYSQVPLTAPSHASILTGTYPQFHQVNDFALLLPIDLPYAPAILKAHGYKTAAFVGAMVLDPVAGLAPGFERGFDTYDAGYRRLHPGEDRFETFERRGGEVVAHALAWLNQHPRGPYFMWVHLYDPHDPYVPPEPYLSRYKSAPYDGEIAYADSAVGKFLDQLRKRGLYENSVIAVMADHGESLGDHGEDTHGIFLYDETIHVPLLFKLPREHFGGQRIDSRVELVDVLPTILQAVGIAVPQEVQGESLLEMMKPSPIAKAGAEPERSNDRPAYAEADYSKNTFRWSSLRSLRTGKYLFIEAPRRELYDQTADPQAEHNLAPSSKAVADTLTSQLDDFRQKTKSSHDPLKASLDAGQREKLAALGYIAPDSGGSPVSGSDGPAIDPKDKIEIVNLVRRVEILLDAGQFQEALPLAQQVVANDPGIFLAYRELGKCYFALHDFKNAALVMRKAVELRPDSSQQRYDLGVALFESGDPEAAVKEFETAVVLTPQWHQGHVMLATAYARTGRMEQALKECEKMLEENPDDYRVLLIEGRVLLHTKQPEAALPKLLKAVELQPDAPEAHRSLGEVYSQLGRSADAARERATEERLKAADKH